MNNNDLVKKIIAENIYMSMATVEVKPWVVALRYSIDKNYIFYFVSKRDTKHVAHILKNTSTACAIFDSHQADGTGQGIQMDGQTFLVEGKELEKVVKEIWPGKLNEYTKNFSGNSIYRLFKFVPEHIFILDPTDIAADRRVEVNL